MIRGGLSRICIFHDKHRSGDQDPSEQITASVPGPIALRQNSAPSNIASLLRAQRPIVSRNCYSSLYAFDSSIALLSAISPAKSVLAQPDLANQQAQLCLVSSRRINILAPLVRSWSSIKRCQMPNSCACSTDSRPRNLYVGDTDSLQVIHACFTFLL